MMCEKHLIMWHVAWLRDVSSTLFYQEGQSAGLVSGGCDVEETHWLQAGQPMLRTY